MLVKTLAFVLLVSVAAAVRSDVPRATFIDPSKPPGDVYFWETFNHKEQRDRWIHSAASKDGTDGVAKYDGKWNFTRPINLGGFEADTGLVLDVAARHYAIAAATDRPYDFSVNKDAFVIQYEVNFQDTLTCGGGYIKLLSSADKLDQFHDKTPYSIMFGPDKCGQSSKLHFIIRFKNPKTGEIEEKHCKQPDVSSYEHVFTDKRTNLYTLVIGSNDRYSVAINQEVVYRGGLLDDFTPSFVPPEEIDDPSDKKPADWDDKEKIPDPDAVKPDDWDEDAPQKIADPDAVKPEGWLDDGPETIPDPDATKPDDWDEEEDGTWEAPTIPNPVCEEVGCGVWTPPMIANPAYKGKWRAPMIENPNYMGIWKPKRIPNPGYFEMEGTVFTQLTSIAAVGFELWSMSKDIYFDNIIIASELTSASLFSTEGWIKKMESERVATGADYLGPWMEWVIELANDYPYLWALYAVVLVLPFVLCAACCLGVKSRPSDDVAKRKKTDAPTPDDPRPLEEEEKKKKSEETFVASSEEEEEKEKPSSDTAATDEDKPVENVGKDEGEGEKEAKEDEEGFKPRKSPRRGKGKKTQRED